MFKCGHPICATLLPEKGYCPAHAHLAPPKYTETDKHYDQEKRDKWSIRFYRSAQWLSARRWILAHEPECRRCKRRLAQMVHHIQPVKEIRILHPHLLTAEENLMPLCWSCHAIIEGEMKCKLS